MRGILSSALEINIWILGPALESNNWILGPTLEISRVGCEKLHWWALSIGTMTGRGYLCNKFLLQQIFKIHEQRIGSHRKPGTVNWSP